MNIVKAIQLIHPGAQAYCQNNDYDTIIWAENNPYPLPSLEELQAAWDSRIVIQPLDWEGLYEDLESSSLLQRLILNSTVNPEIATPLNVLISLITNTKKQKNLQNYLNLIKVVLMSSRVNKPLTLDEQTWLNERLSDRGFKERV